MMLLRLKPLGLFLLTWFWVVLIGGRSLPAHSLTSAPLPTLESRPPLVEPFRLQALLPPEAMPDLVQQGQAAYVGGRYQAAIALWQQASTQYQAAADRLGQVMVTNQIAQAYQALRQWVPAQGAIATSFALLQAAGNSERSQLLTAQAWNIQGLSQFQQGQLQAALESWQQAVQLYTQVRQETGRLGSLLNLAQAQQALGFYRQAQATLLQVSTALDQQADSRLKALSLLHLGNLLRLTGTTAPLTSAAVLQNAQAVAQRLQQPDLLAAVDLALGNTAWANQQAEQAIAYYQQAQQVAPNSWSALQAGLNRLALAIERQEWAIARPLLPTLQAQVEQGESSHVSLYARLHLAQSLIKLGQGGAIAPADSLPLLAATQAAARELGDARAESYALGYRGQVYRQLGQFGPARHALEQALLIAQGLPAPEIAYQWEWQLGQLFRQQQQPELARTALAQAYSSLSQLRLDLVAVNPEIQFNFREQVEPVYRDYIDSLVPTTTTDSPDRKGNLSQARQVLESLRLAELTNFLGINCLQPVAVDQVAQRSDAAVIYPILLPQRLVLIVSLADQLRSYSVPISQAEVTDVVNRFRQELEKPYTSSRAKQLAQTLEGWLIQPLAVQLRQAEVQTLVFVLDSSLRNIPMAALYDGQRYLMERYAVALAPGLTLLTPSPLKQQPFNALLLGLTQARQGFAQLVNVAPELQTIRSLVPSQVLLDEAFTKTNFQARVQNAPFSIVHLATHGQFGSTIDQTFVLAWDGRINVSELRNLLQTTSPGIDLLVLSACETAEGDDRAALGLAGVAVQSGTRRTLASLWSVDDQSGAVFTRHFYEALVQGGGSPAEALRQAQRQLLKDPSYRHPRYWAPYVLLGSWL